MSAGTATNVTTGKRGIDGGIYAAPIGTTLPVTATETLNAAFKNLGYISEEGFKIVPAVNRTIIKEWGGLDVANEPDTISENANAKYIEGLNVDMLKTIYGPDNVTVDASGNIHIASKIIGGTPYSYVVDIAQRGGRLRRIVIPNGVISNLGDIAFNGKDPVAYDATIGMVMGPTGTTHDEYISAAGT